MKSWLDCGLPLLLVAGVTGTLPPGGFAQETVEERLRVVESAVIVKPPSLPLGGLPWTSVGPTPGVGLGPNVVPQRRPRQRKLLVYLGDDPLDVTGVQRIDRDTEWTVLLYLDAALTRSDTLFRSALALAKTAERLTALGPVELVVAEPKARVRLPPTRFPRALQNALADVAMQASGGELGGDLAELRGRSIIRRHRTGEPDATGESAAHELIGSQVSALSKAARDRCRTDACLMLLVSEGFSEVASSTAPAPTSSTDASRRLARELAAARWLVGVVVVREERDLKDIPPGQRPPEMRQLDAAIPPANYMRNAATVLSSQSQSISLDKLDVVVRLESEPLKRVVRASGGFLAASARELNRSLRDLDERVLVWFRHPAETAAGALPLRVVFAPRGIDLWAPRWWRFRQPTR